MPSCGRDLRKVRNITGPHGKRRYIFDLCNGENGYTAPWAYQDGKLNADYRVETEPVDDMTMRVTCNGDGTYDIHFTELYLE